MESKTTFLSQLPIEKRRKVRKELEGVLALRKQQIANWEKFFIEPQRKNKELIERTLKSDYPIEPMLKNSKKLYEWIEMILKRTHQ